MRLAMHVPLGQPLTQVGDVTSALPDRTWDANFQMETEFYKNTARFELPLRVDAGAKPGPAEAKIEVRFQVCSDQSCLPPTKVTLPLRLQILRDDSKLNR